MDSANGYLFGLGFNKSTDLYHPPKDSFHSSNTEIISLHSNSFLAFWGEKHGDVNYFHNEDYLFLINGYITNNVGSSPSFNIKEFSNLIQKSAKHNRVKSFLDKIVPILSGSFSILFVDFIKNEIFIASDRIGSRALWHGFDGNKIYISSHSLAIAKCSNKLREFDPAGILSFFLYGTQINPSDCIFRNIKSLEEGSILNIKQRSDIKQNKYYSFSHKPENRTKKEWVAIATKCIRESANKLRATSQSFGLFLSGGVDSRLVLSALVSVGIEPLLLTLSDSPNIETSVSKSVSNFLGLKHKFFFRDPEWYLRNLENAVFESNGVQVWTHAHFRESCIAAVQDYDIQSFLLGGFSEAFSKLFSNTNHLHSGPWSPDLFLSEFDNLLPSLYQPANRYKTLNLFQDDFQIEATKLLNQNIVNRFQKLKDSSEELEIIVDQFLRWQNANCHPAYEMQMDVRSAACERNLMFDIDIIDLLERLPAEMRNDSHLGCDIIRALCPPMSNIINSNTMLPLWFSNRLHSSSKKIRPVIGKILRSIRGASHQNQGSWPSKANLYLKNSSWEKSITSIIENQNLFPSDIFRINAIGNKWLQFKQGDSLLQFDIERIVGFGHICKNLSNNQS